MVILTLCLWKGQWNQEVKHYEKKNQSLKGKNCYVLCHMTTPCSIRGGKHCKYSNQFWVIIHLKISLSENVFDFLEILIGLEDPMNWGIRRDTDWRGILTLNFRNLRLYFIWVGTKNIFFIFTSIRSNTYTDFSYVEIIQTERQ